MLAPPTSICSEPQHPDSRRTLGLWRWGPRLAAGPFSCNASRPLGGPGDSCTGPCLTAAIQGGLFANAPVCPRRPRLIRPTSCESRLAAMPPD